MNFNTMGRKKSGDYEINKKETIGFCPNLRAEGED